ARCLAKAWGPELPATDTAATKTLTRARTTIGRALNLSAIVTIRPLPKGQRFRNAFLPLQRGFGFLIQKRVLRMFSLRCAPWRTLGISAIQHSRRIAQNCAV